MVSFSLFSSYLSFHEAEGHEFQDVYGQEVDLNLFHGDRQEVDLNLRHGDRQEVDHQKKDQLVYH